MVDVAPMLVHWAKELCANACETMASRVVEIHPHRADAHALVRLPAGSRECARTAVRARRSPSPAGGDSSAPVLRSHQPAVVFGSGSVPRVGLRLDSKHASARAGRDFAAG